MSELQSSLPEPETIALNRTMQIVRVNVSECTKRVVETYINQTKGATTERVTATLYEIDDDRVRGYVPTKTLVVDGFLLGTPQIEMVFFANPSLPPAARPYQGGNTYALVVWVDNRTIIDYDIDMHVLIDQQAYKDRVVYIFVFGNKQYNSVVAKEIR